LDDACPRTHCHAASSPAAAASLPFFTAFSLLCSKHPYLPVPRKWPHRLLLYYLWTCHLPFSLKGGEGSPCSSPYLAGRHGPVCLHIGNNTFALCTRLHFMLLCLPAHSATSSPHLSMPAIRGYRFQHYLPHLQHRCFPFRAYATRHQHVTSRFSFSHPYPLLFV